MSALCRKSARLEAKTMEGFLVLVLPWDLGQTLTLGILVLASGNWASFHICPWLKQATCGRTFSAQWDSIRIYIFLEWLSNLRPPNPQPHSWFLFVSPYRWSGRSWNKVASEPHVPISQKHVSQRVSKQQGVESELTVIYTCLMNINEASCL